MGTIPNLTDALFSQVLQRVLGVLYGQPDRSFHTNEIIRLTHSGRGATQREIEKLAAVNLITVKHIGNQKHYQANPATPLFSELRSIVLKTFGLADILRDAFASISSQVQIAFIYGSVAKQEDTANSDIDLMLIGNDLTYADLFKTIEKIETQVGRSIHPTFYSPAEWKQKRGTNNNFLNQIIKQPKIFIIGNEDELTKLG